jgi:hypothetical protein
VGDVDQHRSYLSKKGQGEMVSVSDNRSSSPGGTMFSGRGEHTYHRSMVCLGVFASSAFIL